MTIKGLNRRGFTAMEILLTVLMMSLVTLAVTAVGNKTFQYVHKITVRQGMQSDADQAMNTIMTALQHAQAHTVMICRCHSNACTATCPSYASYAPPYSRIEFTPAGATNNEATAIYWSPPTKVLNGNENTGYSNPNITVGSVWMMTGGTFVYGNGSWTFNAPDNAKPVELAKNVTVFTISGDGMDLSKLFITLRIDAPATSGSVKDSVTVINQAVQLEK